MRDKVCKCDKPKPAEIREHEINRRSPNKWISKGTLIMCDRCGGTIRKQRRKRRR